MSIFCLYHFKIDRNIDKKRSLGNSSTVSEQDWYNCISATWLFPGKVGISALSASPGKTGIAVYNYRVHCYRSTCNNRRTGEGISGLKLRINSYILALEYRKTLKTDELMVYLGFLCIRSLVVQLFQASSVILFISMSAKQ